MLLTRTEAVLGATWTVHSWTSAVVESMWEPFARDHGMSERFDDHAYSPPDTTAGSRRSWRRRSRTPSTSASPVRRSCARRGVWLRSLGPLVTALINTCAPLPWTHLPQWSSCGRVWRRPECPSLRRRLRRRCRARQTPLLTRTSRPPELRGYRRSCLVLEDATSRAGYPAARRAGAQVLLVGTGAPRPDPHVLR